MRESAVGCAADTRSAPSGSRVNKLSRLLSTGSGESTRTSGVIATVNGSSRSNCCGLACTLAAALRVWAVATAGRMTAAGCTVVKPSVPTKMPAAKATTGPMTATVRTLRSCALASSSANKTAS
eukprot:scaffold249692_cov26-Tisochrysis_lutea.AAC.1